jgi:hypothetical protein
VELTTARLARDFAAGLMLADARNPRWGAYQPGIGPHTEVQTVALVLAELRREPSCTVWFCADWRSVPK